MKFRNCGAECWFAQQEQCSCICGGINHGKLIQKKLQPVMKAEFTFTGAIPSKKNSYLMGKGRFFSDPKVVEWTDTNIVLLRDQLNKQNIVMQSVSSSIKFTVRFSKYRLDVDNKLNTIFDLLQKGQFILNDMDICEVHVFKPTKEEKRNKDNPFEAVITLEWE